jgi:hypothetical protein
LLIFLTPTVLWTEAHDHHHFQQESQLMEMPCEVRSTLQRWQEPTPNLE